jgi:glycosyltransferase involved in cell wall biosynthesis
MRLAFISTNSMFGGSEILFLKTANLLSQNNTISIYTRYDIDNSIFTVNRNIQCINYIRKNKLSEKIKNRLSKTTTDLKLNLIKKKPDLIVISQGSPFSSLKEMEICLQLGKKFIVINQLVSEYHWLELNDRLFSRFQAAFSSSSTIFFVSRRNKELFDLFFGNITNSKQINNPISVENQCLLNYPIDNEKFKIAYVGRIEFYHKGIDMLIEVLKDPIWKERNVEFSFIGKGPHVEILQNLFDRFQLSFCKYYYHTNDLKQVWLNHHIAILPSRFEGKSLSITESMCYGRAVIITDVGGANEQVDDNLNGFLIKEPTLDSLKKTLNYAWEKRFEWKKMGENARLKFIKSNHTSPEYILAEHILNI